MNNKNLNKKMNNRDKYGQPQMRVWNRKRKGLKSNRLLLKCGDCDEHLQIHYPDLSDKSDDLIEIGGVSASRKNWIDILKPILKLK